MSNKKDDPGIRVLEIVYHNKKSYEIRMAAFEKEAVPVIVGLLEKAKFDLLARDFDEEGSSEEIPMIINDNNKFDA